MNYSTIRIEGSILSADILDRIEQGDLGGQSPSDFGFSGSVKVKDEIVSAWADAQAMWQIFSKQKDKVAENATGTSETRKFWIIPLLSLMGYEPEVSRQGEVVNDRNYSISHRESNMGDFPIHVMGFNDSLDKKREDSGPRMSPHALVQEYVNVTEHLYAIVTNGLQLRLLRDSSRLVKLSFMEFNLEAMMEEEHYADFAIMYRLLHASRMPQTPESGGDSLIEKYHQDALESGSRIREGLSKAVEQSILGLANGMLTHPANSKLRSDIERGTYRADEMYQHLLRIIYRLLFLMVTEERRLVFAAGTNTARIKIYYEFYSVMRLRRLCEKQHVAVKGFSDYWISLRNIFRLFESNRYGAKLCILPLAGDLFGPEAIGGLSSCELDNAVLVECLRNLSVFTNANTGQKMRVNYAALNVEEFGSVYEGLLEYDPDLRQEGGQWTFRFVKGEGRSSSGSHYTPEELVQPLIKHSLDYIIEDKLKESDKENALLSITVCDVACGSGHILLSAARRIAIEVARVRTGEDQPSPTAMRKATRDVIRHCIYGVDKNPLAVELCKVSLWLESHSPGEPLSFLDHRIKCGDAIVGLAHKEDLNRSIPDEAFKTLPEDDKEVAATFRKRNKTERVSQKTTFDFEQTIGHPLGDVVGQLRGFDAMPETTPEEIVAKKKRYRVLTSGTSWWRLKTLADIQVAQFFISKSVESREKLITDAEYRAYLTGARQPIGQAVAQAQATAVQKRFFHWFLEFPEVFEGGGFSCVLGNPPFLGNRGLRGAFGVEYLNYLTTAYAPAGAIDLVGYFFRRIFTIIRNSGYQALISTNTIAQGGTREGSLDIIANDGGAIDFAMRSVKWPGVAAVNVSLVAIHKGAWNRSRFLDGKSVAFISTYLDDAKTIGEPLPLFANQGKSFQGSIVLGKGFILTEDEARKLIAKDPKNKDVLFPYLNGDDLNSRPDQSPSRWVINFFDWPIEKAMEYEDCFRIVEEKVKPERIGSSKDVAAAPWWQFWRQRNELYRTIAGMERVLVVTRVSKTLALAFVPTDLVFSDATVVFARASAADFAVLQSSLHAEWAWRHCSTMKGDLRYTPTVIYETLPKPGAVRSDVGDRYHQHRSTCVATLGIGLTKVYNLFHTSDLAADGVAKIAKRELSLCEEGVVAIHKLRELHREMDRNVLSAYGWSDINLAHAFYEVDYLPENDRVRYTISPEARREVLKRLLELNHQRHAEEVAAGLVDAAGKPLKKKSRGQTTRKTNKVNANVNVVREDSAQYGLFGPGEEVKAVLFVEGNTDELYIRTAATTCNRTDLLDGITIIPCTGAKEAREAAVGYRETHGESCQIRVLFDWDDIGKVEYDKLKSDSLWGKKMVWTYRNWKQLEPSTVPVEAEDMFENGLLEAFIESCGDKIVTEKQKYKDGTFHYGIEQNQKKSLEYWVEHNAKPEHCRRWIKLLEDLRKSVGLG